MPDEGATAWDDLILGRDRVPEREARGPRHRSLGRPADVQLRLADRGLARRDHARHPRRATTSRTRRSRSRSSRRSAPPLPEYGHLPNVHGPDGKKLSKRHGAVTVEEFRAQGYIPEALVNFLALLGWSYDDKTTIMSRDELVERFTLERVGASPAIFDYQKLEWLNGVYLRALSPEEYADALVAYLREQGYDWDEELVRRAVPLVQEKIETLGEFPEFAGFLFARGRAGPGQLDDGADAPRGRRGAGRGRAVRGRARSRRRCAALAERLGLKPRDAFQPIRVAVTGSKVSPGLFESIELLGRDESRSRGSARQRPRRRERVERALELEPGPAPEAAASGPGGGRSRWPHLPFLSHKRELGAQIGYGGYCCAPADGGDRCQIAHRAGRRRRSRRSGCSAASTSSSTGYRVLEATTLAEAERAARTREPVDVVLLDVHVGRDERPRAPRCELGARRAARAGRARHGHVGSTSSRATRPTASSPSRSRSTEPRVDVVRRGSTGSAEPLDSPR